MCLLLIVTIATQVLHTSSGEDSQDNLVDASYSTYWNALRATTEWVVLDVGDVRWITALTIQSSGNLSSPKNCLLQSSLTTGAGPFTTGIVSHILHENLSHIISNF